MDEQLAGYGSGIQIWDLGGLCRERRKCFFDGQIPVLMGSYYLFRALQETWLVVYPGVGREYFQSSFGTWARLGAGRIRFLL